MPAHLAPALMALTLSLTGAAPLAAPPASSPYAPRVAGPQGWARHVEQYPGPLTHALDEALSAGRTSTHADRASGTPDAGGNQQVGIDTEPPVRQSNPTVAASLRHPAMAVAAMNDAAGGGYQLLRTKDGGRTWGAIRQVPQLPDGLECSVQTPSIAYSRRDDTFVLAVYCGTPDGASSVQLWTSHEGRTWTAPAYAATAATNVDPETGEADPSVFYSWDNVAVDNAPGSPHYGRTYVTWSKYHLLASGESDYCPAQVAWTDSVAPIPRDTTFTVTQLGPDGHTPHGVGPYTSAWTRLAVQPDGHVLALYAQEDCNSGRDRHLRVATSHDGGVTFGPPRTVDRPGEFADNPDLDDVLPDKSASLGISPSIAVDPRTGVAAAVYQDNVDRAATGADVWVSTSPDGVTWSGRPLATGHQGRAARNDQFFPWVTTDPTGHWRVVWLDDRRDPGNHRVDAWEARSDDDFGSWTSQRISTTSYDPDNTATFGSSLGVVTAIAASSAAVFPLWPDARDNDVVRTGVPDLDVWTDVEGATP